MLNKAELNQTINIAYNTYKDNPKKLVKEMKHKRIKDSHGFLSDIYFNKKVNTLYISFQGITQHTLKSSYFKHNMRTGGGHEYSQNFPKIKFWLNAFANKYSDSLCNMRVVVIGHSMGGSLAQLLVSDILYRNIFKDNIKTKNLSLITFNGLGGKIGNYFLNTSLIKTSRRDKKLAPLVSRLWRQVETYHFVHRDDIVAKILEHENKHRIFLVDIDNKKTLNAFHGEVNAHDIDIFYEMAKKKTFKPVHCDYNNFEQFNLNEFLNGWMPIVSLFYLLMFKTGESRSFYNWLNPSTYYNKFKQISEIKSDILIKFYKMENKASFKKEKLSVINA